MSKPKIDVFFYGSYINFDVLAEVDIVERPYQVAWLPNHKLLISPLANLVKDTTSIAFGIVTKLTHDELERLYVEHAQGKLGGTYLPEAVLIHVAENVLMPAITYISHDMTSGQAANDYVQRILRPAQKYQFPDSYLKHIESFA